MPLAPSTPRAEFEALERHKYARATHVWRASRKLQTHLGIEMPLTPAEIEAKRRKRDGIEGYKRKRDGYQMTTYSEVMEAPRVKALRFEGVQQTRDRKSYQAYPLEEETNHPSEFQLRIYGPDDDQPIENPPRDLAAEMAELEQTLDDFVKGVQEKEAKKANLKGKDESAPPGKDSSAGKDVKLAMREKGASQSKGSQARD